jgi:alkanesulfonate monooxygenase SsuD/methylene tetrahydromethanopterin reductase-like flavin-dependent oxidoreductase (luciferase family)
MIVSEFHLYLPQMRLSFEELEAHAKNAEAAGFEGMAFMDHFAPPMAETQPMYEALVTATWLAARTERLRMGHLVLCDAFRHPAVLAKQVASIDRASGGRFELGMGWGSVPAEFDTFGVDEQTPGARIRRLDETLQVLRALWSGESVDFDGEFHHLRGAMQQPAPLGRIPIVIGGTGKKTLELVARHADWWNLQIGNLYRLDELRASTGNARTSLQQMVCFVPSEQERAEVEALARRRFGGFGDAVMFGTAPELVDQLHALADRGVGRFYIWFTDFAAPATLAAFGEQVIPQLASA